MRDPVTKLAVVDIDAIDVGIRKVLPEVFIPRPHHTPLIFYAGRFTKKTKFEFTEKQNRIMLVTNADILTFKEDGKPSRAIPILSISEILVFPDSCNIIKCSSTSSSTSSSSLAMSNDFVFRLDALAELDYLINILQVVKKYHEHDPSRRFLSIRGMEGSWSSYKGLQLSGGGKGGGDANNASFSLNRIPLIRLTDQRSEAVDVFLRPPKPPKSSHSSSGGGAAEPVVKNLDDRIGAVLAHPLFHPPDSQEYGQNVLKLNDLIASTSQPAAASGASQQLAANLAIKERQEALTIMAEQEAEKIAAEKERLQQEREALTRQRAELEEAKQRMATEAERRKRRHDERVAEEKNEERERLVEKRDKNENGGNRANIEAARAGASADDTVSRSGRADLVSSPRERQDSGLLPSPPPPPPFPPPQQRLVKEKNGGGENGPKQQDRKAPQTPPPPMPTQRALSFEEFQQQQQQQQLSTQTAAGTPPPSLYYESVPAPQNYSSHFHPIAAPLDVSGGGVAPHVNDNYHYGNAYPTEREHYSHHQQHYAPHLPTAPSHHGHYASLLHVPPHSSHFYNGVTGASPNGFHLTAGEGDAVGAVLRHEFFPPPSVPVGAKKSKHATGDTFLGEGSGWDRHTSEALYHRPHDAMYNENNRHYDGLRFRPPVMGNEEGLNRGAGVISFPPDTPAEVIERALSHYDTESRIAAREVAIARLQQEVSVLLHSGSTTTQLNEATGGTSAGLLRATPITSGDDLTNNSISSGVGIRTTLRIASLQDELTALLERQRSDREALAEVINLRSRRRLEEVEAETAQRRNNELLGSKLSSRQKRKSKHSERDRLEATHQHHHRKGKDWEGAPKSRKETREKRAKRTSSRSSSFSSSSNTGSVTSSSSSSGSDYGSRSSISISKSDRRSNRERERGGGGSGGERKAKDRHDHIGHERFPSPQKRTSVAAQELKSTHERSDPVVNSAAEPPSTAVAPSIPTPTPEQKAYAQWYYSQYAPAVAAAHVAAAAGGMTSVSSAPSFYGGVNAAMANTPARGAPATRGLTSAQQQSTPSSVHPPQHQHRGALIASSPSYSNHQPYGMMSPTPHRIAISNAASTPATATRQQQQGVGFGLGPARHLRESIH